MDIKSADLPGVGKKYTFRSAEGICIVVVIHHTGHRELYFMECDDSDDYLFTFELNDDEARKLGSIMMGVDYQPVSDDKIAIMQKNIMVEWISLSSRSSLVGKTIKETKIRTKTGVTIIGIKRGEDVIGSPDIDEKFLADDILMVIGKKSNIKTFEALAKGDS